MELEKERILKKVKHDLGEISIKLFDVMCDIQQLDLKSIDGIEQTLNTIEKRAEIIRGNYCSRSR